MAEVPLKFRCYQCNQLLGVPPRRAGSVIACPRCKAELLVPRPESEPEPALAEELAPGSAPVGRSRSRGAAAESRRTEAGSFPSFLNEIDTAIPEDLVALRPEDIRVEAEFADLVVTTSEPTSLATAHAPISAFEPVESSAEPITADTFLAEVPPVSSFQAQATAEQPPVNAAPGTVLPEISIEPPTILPANRPIGPVREVLIQPAVLLVWSMIVLLALPMSFIAGLLIGHFLWKSP